jgi:hypothetical protein
VSSRNSSKTSSREYSLKTEKEKEKEKEKENDFINSKPNQRNIEGTPLNAIICKKEERRLSIVINNHNNSDNYNNNIITTSNMNNQGINNNNNNNSSNNYPNTTKKDLEKEKKVKHKSNNKISREFEMGFLTSDLTSESEVEEKQQCRAAAKGLVPIRRGWGDYISMEKVFSHMKHSSLCRQHSFEGKALVDWLMGNVSFSRRMSARLLGEQLWETFFDKVGSTSFDDSEERYRFNPMRRSIAEILQDSAGQKLWEGEFQRLLAHLLGFEPDHHFYLRQLMLAGDAQLEDSALDEIIDAFRAEADFKGLEEFLRQNLSLLQHYVTQLSTERLSPEQIYLCAVTNKILTHLAITSRLHYA